MTSSEEGSTVAGALGGLEHTNVAEPGSRVEVQVSVMHGDINNYRLTGDTPEENYRVGRNYLDANAQRKAEELICKAFMSGYQTTEVAYYWVLATLSGRSFDNLDKEDFANISKALHFVDAKPKNKWSQALSVVASLVQCLAHHEREADGDIAELGEVLTAFDGLPDERREEIRRHLAMILEGAIQDHIDARDAEDIGVRRMADHRRRRAWKFFEPDPTPPVAGPSEKVAFSLGALLGLFAGMSLSGFGLALLLPPVFRSGPINLALAVSLFGGGSLFTVKFSWQRLRQLRRLQTKREELAPIPADQTYVSKEVEDFAKQLRRVVDVEFACVQPTDEDFRKRWDRAVNGIKCSLRRELVRIYGAQRDISRIRWLIRWYARDAYQSAKHDTFPNHRLQFRITPFTNYLIALNATISAIGAGIGIVAAFTESWLVTLAATPIIVIGGFLLAYSGTRLSLQWQHRADIAAERSDRHAEQCVAYDHMTRVLHDRPSDAEMARWLDYDKTYARMLAMNTYHLTNRKVIAHAVLSQGSGFCRQARVFGGPPRYSCYQLLVFLLTDEGVRQVTVEVNFGTGVIRNERRMNFHYTTVASARVIEIGVRPEGPDAQSTRPNPEGPLEIAAKAHVRRARPGQALVLSRSFRLSLVNNEAITITVENFDEGLVDRLREDPQSILELALDAAGVTGALGVLEAVAAEGRTWIERERRRRNRRSHTFEEHVGRPGFRRASGQPSTAGTSAAAANGHGSQPGANGSGVEMRILPKQRRLAAESGPTAVDPVE